MIPATFGDVMISLFPDIIRAIIILFAPLILILGAGWLAGRPGRRRLERVQRLAAIDHAARTPVTRPMDLGGHVIDSELERCAWRANWGPETVDPDPALGCCRFCAPPFDPAARCGCATPCGDPQCGALAWLGVGNTQEWER